MTRIVLILVLLSSVCLAGDRNAWLEGEHQMVLYVWRDWMKKPSLKWSPISNEALGNFLGKWVGVLDDGDAKVNLDLDLRKDGTWRSKEFRPRMKRGHWYLYKGMIQLYEAEISEMADFASVLFVRDKEFRLMDADATKGYVVLKKQAVKTDH
jgi:hypothetical protein